MKMNLFFLPLQRPLAAVALLLLGALSLPDAAMAKPDKKGNSSGHGSKSEQNHGGRKDHGGRDQEHYRSEYHSRSRSSFTLNPGIGYAGRGYYYGPANSPYYYPRSGVRYYATRELAPRAYWGQETYRGVSLGASVQQALARQGYYRGEIDGQIGPYSRRAIARYQNDHGLAPTGRISSSLLRALRLQ